MQLSELQQSETTTIYHGTTEGRLKSIMSNGLDPRMTEHGLIFLTNDLKNAQTWAYEMCIADNGTKGNPCILVIDMDQLDKSLLEPNTQPGSLLDIHHQERLENEPDFYQGLDDYTWEESLLHSFEVAYAGKIPPSAIKVLG